MLTPTPTRRRVPLAVPPWGDAEVDEAIDSLRSGHLTMGAKVARFERLWADYIGVNHAIMVNSGSSANLLALTALKAQGLLKDGDEIITPALTWATTVFPIAQVGCVPVLVDVERETYNIDPKAFQAAITPKTAAVMPVHLLGNPCDIINLDYTVKGKRLLLIEDACEAHGAEYHGRKVGIPSDLYDLSTFSFFFSHHISTIEGGMVVTDSAELAATLRALRAFGWVRERRDPAAFAAEYPGIDPRFLFTIPGYNFRPTEIQGAFGIHQVPRLEGYLAHRAATARYWNEALAPYQDWLRLPEQRPGTRHAWFAYPMQTREGAPFTAQALMAHLEGAGIEARPIEAGAMHLQPAMAHINWRAGGSLTNAEYLHRHSFFIGNHHGIGAPEREYVAETVKDFLGRYR